MDGQANPVNSDITLTATDQETGIVTPLLPPFH
jgi:hypothetical protein